MQDSKLEAWAHQIISLTMKVLYKNVQDWLIHWLCSKIIPKAFIEISNLLEMIYMNKEDGTFLQAKSFIEKYSNPYKHYAF